MGIPGSRGGLAAAILLVCVGTARANEPATGRIDAVESGHDPLVSTFSIVAFDPETREWGVGVASKYLAVGGIVPFARSEAGAIATQSYANTAYGYDGLTLLASGKSAEETLQTLINGDDRREIRQVGIVDANGKAATYTGEKCHSWAGGKTGVNYACQGNILTGPEVIDAMAQTYEQTKGPLCWRILAALEAAEAAGGDSRGKQAAAVLVVRQRDDGGPHDRFIDFRVDDHPEPVTELARILGLKVKRPEPSDE